MAQIMENLLSLAALKSADIPASALAMARLSLFDWTVVARAGRNEPAARIIRGMVADEGGAGRASLVGGGMAPARGAALVNGTISHALDYDDTHFGHVGHLSVGIYPAALALAEDRGASRDAAIEAFLLGAEAAVRLGMVLGTVHYNRGFHQTATAGAFGATVAAGRVLGLDAEKMRAALSLVATRASGLKSQFGTMGKPYNAGVAASNGVEAALLAARGFTSADDGVAGPQGFIDTHSDAPDPARFWHSPPPATFLFEDNKYKLHACCHGTHAMIEALAAARAASQIPAGDVRRISIRVNPRWLRVCDIKAPRTGLEVKFSYCWLAAMVFAGIDTAADSSYADALCADPALAAFASRLEVEGDASLSDTATVGVIETGDGRQIAISHDLAARLSPSALEHGLRKKAAGLLGEAEAGRLWEAATAGDVSAARIGELLRQE